MLKWIAKRQIDAFERRWDYDSSYVREMIDQAGVDAVMPLQGLTKLGNYRRNVPLGAYYAATLTASRAADCGPCLQLGVSMAESQGVQPDLIRAILQGDREAMTGEARLGADLALATIARDGSGDDVRAEILRRWGRRGLLSMAYGIVAAQAYPALKYAIGYGRACVRVRVGGQPVAVRSVQAV